MEITCRPSPQPLTPERVSQLKQNEDIVQLLYIAEQYLGKTLSRYRNAEDPVLL